MKSYKNEENDEKLEYFRSERAKRTLKAIAITGVMLIPFTLFLHFIDIIPRDIAKPVIATTIFSIMAISIYYYLQSRPITTPGYLRKISTIQKLRLAKSTIDEVDDLIKSLENIPKTEESKEEDLIIERIKENYYEICYEWYYPNGILDLNEELFKTPTGIEILKGNIKNARNHIVDIISQESEKQTKELLETEKKLEKTIALGDRAHSRLTGEILQLSKRANIYISIGTVITCIAGYALYLTAQDTYQYISLSSQNSFQEILQPKIIIGLAVKLSIVVFIEIFAFYFLKMHREIMENIKYYQNEITNIDLKIAGLSASESSEECMAIAVKELLKTERNFLIKQKHTTVELEKNKQNISLNKDLINLITKTLKPK